MGIHNEYTMVYKFLVTDDHPSMGENNPCFDAQHVESTTLTCHTDGGNNEPVKKQ